MAIMRVGLDLAKSIFEICAIDEHEHVVQRKTLKRNKVLSYFCQLPPCIVGMESCGGAHYWGRELRKLGHEVRMMAPQFVAPYRKNEKNDRNDAEAICEAAGRPSMRFIPIKDEEQQAILTVHRARTLLVGERTALVNQIRGFLTEFGIVLPQGRRQIRAKLPTILDDEVMTLPHLLCSVLADQYRRLCELDHVIEGYDHQIESLARTDERAKRLMKVEGIGPLTATALIATVGDIREFKNGRQFAAWLGLVPRQRSSGGRVRQGRITKRGDVYLRTLLVHGARAIMRFIDNKHDRKSEWVKSIKERRGFNKAAVALAAKHARILWAILSKESDYEVYPVN